jgi:hypothetical protein
MPHSTVEESPARARTQSFAEEMRPLLQIRWLQLAALTFFLGGIGGIAFRKKFFVIDSDIWWHLKVGDWIVAHFAVPHTGILSRTAASRPWVAYSWGYELLLSRAYAWGGLVGIGVFGGLLTVGVAVAVYWMLHRLSGRFWLSLIGAGIVCSAFLFDGSPRPFFFSVSLFALTLTLLLEAHRRARIEPLYWLPLIFFFWANLHIQFIYGLFLIGLYVGVNLVQRFASWLGFAPQFLLCPSLSAPKLVAIFAACVLATLAGPNFYHPYVAVYEYSRAKFTYSVIIELQPLSFRYVSQYTELLIAAAGFYAVGWQNKLDPFKLSLLAIAAVVAFRTQRDGWFICLSAAACIADFPAPEVERDRLASWLEGAGVAAAVAVLLILALRPTDMTQRGLDRAISAEYPVNAINFLRHNPVPGPLYNNLNWGGFLMWYMPQYPVAIDGRNDLYGDDLDKIFYDTQSAEKSYLTDPYLNESGVVLLDSKLPLAKILTIDPRFRLIYHDDIATVYAHR